MSHLRITDAPSLQSSVWRLIVALNFNRRYGHLRVKINLHQNQEASDQRRRAVTVRRPRVSVYALV
jgi:hypothetical protein